MHYKYKDAAGNLLINAALVLYWYNPLLWISAGVMRTDREMACDEAVLYGLDTWEYKAYGNVLINHIENVSLQSSPFVMNLSAGFKNLKNAF
jgi:bla regulator protein BlaR1